MTAGLLYASEAAHEAAQASVTPEKLKDLLWRTLNFAALVVILVKFLTKPIANALGGRRQAIKDQFDDLEARRSEAEQLYKQHEGKLAGLEQEVQQIIAAAVTQGKQEQERIIAEANRAADDIKRQAEMAVQHEIAEARSKLREEVAEQAAIMAEEIIKKNLQGADQAKLIEDYLSKVEG
ncbi:MAG: F0F1 ATP synthase subunit B [Desulfobacteraceae bacterium]|nr:F0F1 ATP synthase subunit B [Desulfobacteraceae bacterium]